MLPEHRTYDHRIQIKSEKQPEYDLLYEMSQNELFIYLFILHSMHAAIKAMTVNRHIVKDVST